MSRRSSAVSEEEIEPVEEEVGAKTGKKKKLEEFNTKLKALKEEFPLLIKIAKQLPEIDGGIEVEVTENGRKETKTFNKKQFDNLVKDFRNQLDLLPQTLKTKKKPGEGKRLGFAAHYRFLDEELYKFFTDPKLKKDFTVNGVYLLDLVPELVEHRLTNDPIIKDLLKAYINNRELYKLSETNKGLKPSQMSPGSVGVDQTMRDALAGVLQRVKERRSENMKIGKAKKSFNLKAFNPTTASEGFASQGSIPYDELSEKQKKIIDALKEGRDKDLKDEIQKETADVNRAMQHFKKTKKNEEEPVRRKPGRKPRAKDEE